jgi:hypothetical protein
MRSAASQERNAGDHAGGGDHVGGATAATALHLPPAHPVHQFTCNAARLASGGYRG